jgi:hypothetical protein
MMTHIAGNAHPKNVLKKLLRSFMNGRPQQQKNFLGSLVTKVTYEIMTILIVGNAHPKNAIKKLSRCFMNGCPI